MAPTVQIYGERVVGRAAERALSGRSEYEVEYLPPGGWGSFKAGDADCLVIDPVACSDNPESAIESLRQTDADLPIVVYTAEGSERLASAVIAAGADEYLPHGEGLTLHSRVARAIESHSPPEPIDTPLPRTVIDETRDVVFVFDTAGTIEYVNDRIEELVPVSRAELVGQSLSAVREMGLLTTDALGELREACQRLASGESEELSLELSLTVGADEVVLDVRLSRLPRSDGSVFVVGTARDISDRKERERELRRYETIVESMDEAAFVVDENRELAYANGRALDDADTQLDELRGRSIHALADEMLVANDTEAFEKALEEVFADEGELPKTVVGHLDLPTGESVGEYKLSRMTEDGEVVGAIVTVRDITERKHQERKLQKLTREYESVFENVQDALFLLDVTEEGAIRFQRFNEHEERATGKSTAEVRDKTPAEVFGAELGAELDANYRECLDRRETVIYEEELEFNGEETVWQTKLTPIIVDGTVEKIVGSGREITEIRRQERELRRKTRAIEKAPVGITIADPSRPDNPLIYANESFLEMTGYDEKEVLGRNCRFLQDEETAVEPVARMREAIDGAKPVDVTLRNYRRDGTEFWNRVSIAPVRNEEGDVESFVGFQLDVTERMERQRELSRYQAFVENSSDVITVIGGDGTIEYANPASRLVSGHDPEELIGRDATDLVHPDDREEMLVELEELIANPDQTVTREYRFEDTDGSWLWVESTGINRLDDPDIEGIVLVTRDVTERKKRQQSLSELHDASRAMVTAPGRDETIEQFLKAADSILHVDSAGVLLFDETENVLAPVDSVSHEENWPGMPTVEPGDSVLWNSFVEGQSQIVEGVTDDSPLADLGLFTSLVVVPLSDYGVFCCVSADRDAFDRRRVELIETLAANAEAVLQRAERERQLRERDEQLREQTARLERLDTVNEQIRHIVRDLVGARTREAIEEVVCTGLAAIDGFEFAWMGRHDSEVVTPTSTAGEAGDYLDAVQPILVQTGREGEPAGRAVASKSLTVVDTVAGELRKGDWQREALSAGLLSVLSVPLEYSGVPYGVLSVYADEANAFDAETRDVLAELAEAIGETYHQIEQRRALVRDERLEVELTVEEATTPLVSLVERLGVSLSVTRVLVQPPGRCFVFGELHTTAETSIQETASDTPGIESVRVIEETANGYRCEIRITRTSLPHSIIEQSGILDRLTPDTDSVSVVATLPQVESVSRTLAALTDRFPGLRIENTRRQQARERQGGGAELLEDIFGDLTERQYEALEVAYQRGYFETPRKSSGTEIAESMDVAPPTFLEHLRRAEYAVFSTLLPRHWRA